jgi:hypothetical protein
MRPLSGDWRRYPETWSERAYRRAMRREFAAALAWALGLALAAYVVIVAVGLLALDASMAGPS